MNQDLIREAVRCVAPVAKKVGISPEELVALLTRLSIPDYPPTGDETDTN